MTRLLLTVAILGSLTQLVDAQVIAHRPAAIYHHRYAHYPVGGSYYAPSSYYSSSMYSQSHIGDCCGTEGYSDYGNSSSYGYRGRYSGYGYGFRGYRRVPVGRRVLRRNVYRAR